MPFSNAQVRRAIEQGLGRSSTMDTPEVLQMTCAEVSFYGLSANTFARCNVIIRKDGAEQPVPLVIKQWAPGGPTDVDMGIDPLPRESLAFAAGIFSPKSMPPQIDVPFVAALDDAEANEHWILLRDVTSELKAFRSPTELAELYRHYSIALDQLALMHATWEKPDRQAWLKKLSWLVPDSARLARGSAVARYLEQAPLGRSESARIESIHDWIENARIKPARETFYRTLTSSDATMWKRHECRRRTLIAKFAEFPTTLVHGDVYPLNIGLRLVDGDDRVILIDWEWIGNGCGALDVAKLLAVGATAAHPDFDSRGLACHYFDRYVAHGGTLFNFASWMRAYELAEVYHALIVHPLATGWSILDSTEHEAYLKAKTPRLAGLIARHLG